MTCAMIFSGVVTPVANASAIPLTSVMSTANTPIMIGRDFTYPLFAMMLSIVFSVMVIRNNALLQPQRTKKESKKKG